VPDGESVARDVTRDPVPVGDRLDILRTHSEAVAHRPGGGEPPLPVPGRPHRRPPGPQRTTAWPRRRRPPDRRAGRDELTNAELAAQASLAQPTLGTGTATRSHAPASATWHTCSPHRSRSAPGTMPRRPSTSVQAGVGSVRSGAHDGTTAAGTSSDHQRWRRLAREHHRRGRAVGLGVGRGGLKPSGSCPASPDA
jgi:hypothetical protein